MQFRKIFLLIGGALGLACTLPCAATSAASSPTVSVRSAPQNLPPARIKQTVADYQRWLNRLGERHAVAGLVTAVVIDGKVVFEGTVG
mgnify:CR=1 FL=1